MRKIVLPPARERNAAAGIPDAAPPRERPRLGLRYGATPPDRSDAS